MKKILTLLFILLLCIPVAALGGELKTGTAYFATGDITVGWDAVSYADGYEVQLIMFQPTPETAYPVTDTTNLSAVLSRPRPGAFRLRVRAYFINENGDKDYGIWCTSDEVGCATVDGNVGAWWIQWMPGVPIIIFDNISPEAALDANVTAGTAPLSVIFDASASFDPDGSIVLYEWNFGDGSGSSAAASVDELTWVSAGTEVTHIYPEPGVYLVTLRVTDDGSPVGTDLATKTITVTEEVPPDPSTLQITNVLAQSPVAGRLYEVHDNLQTGDLVYTDRSYTLLSLPAAYLGQQYIRVANNDKVSTADDFLTFDVNVPVQVIVAHDSRIPYPPTWINTWAGAGVEVLILDEAVNAQQVTYNIYTKTFPAGTVTIGGNQAPDPLPTGNCSNYIIIIKEE